MRPDMQADMISSLRRASAILFALAIFGAAVYGAGLSINPPQGGTNVQQPFPLGPAAVGVVYGPVTLTASGGTSPYNWAIAAGSALPAGLTLSTAGVISGTPTTQGSFLFSIQVADSAQATATAQLSLTVNVAPLTITTISPLFNGTVGQQYSQTLQATGGIPPYAWSVSAGSLPAGLTLDPKTGLISGVPTAPGTSTFTAQVKDSASTPSTATQQFQLVINSPTLVISTPVTLPGGSVGVPYSQTILASGGLKPYTWSVVSGAVPGLTLDPNTGTFSGTPTVASPPNAPYSPRIQVTDASGTTSARTFSLTIAAVTLSITTQSPLPSGTAGQPYTVTLTATGGVPPYTWTAVGLPAGLTLDPNTGIISGTLQAASSPATPFNVVARVTDSTGTNSTVTGLALSVALPPVPNISLTGIPGTSKNATQIPVQVTLDQPYSGDITGQLNLAFAPTITGAADASIQFSTGGTTASYTIPAGQTTAFTTSPVNFQTGTLAGTITVSATANAYALPQTVSPQPVAIATSAPVISSVAPITVSGQNISVAVTGYSPTRDMTTAAFTFAATGNNQLQTSTFNLQVAAPFAAWFKDPSINQWGSMFVYTQTFAITGDPTAVVLKSLVLTNSQGASATFTP